MPTTSTASCAAAVERVGRLDVMVCNAGIAGRWSKGLLETTEEDWDAIMAVNLRGVFLGTKRAVAEMVEQEAVNEVRGRVVIISSQHGMIGPPNHVAYATSKGGVINFVHQVAVDFGPRMRARERGRAGQDPDRQSRRGCGRSCSSTPTRARRSTASGGRTTSRARRSSSPPTTPAT